MLESQLLKRIRAVNLGHIKTAEVIYCQPHPGGDLAAQIFVENHHRSKIEQIRIAKPMIKALTSGSRNPNLDNLLRI